MNARLALNVTPRMLLHLSCMPRLRLQRLSRASSASAASALQRQVDELQGGLIALRGAMDARVVGHDDIKHAVLLGLLSKEHVYIEGPPGVAKTMLAEVIAGNVLNVSSIAPNSWTS